MRLYNNYNISKFINVIIWVYSSWGREEGRNLLFFSKNFIYNMHQLGTTGIMLMPEVSLITIEKKMKGNNWLRHIIKFEQD